MLAGDSEGNEAPDSETLPAGEPGTLTMNPTPLAPSLCQPFLPAQEGLLLPLCPIEPVSTSEGPLPMGAAVLSFPGAEFSKEHKNEAGGLQGENDTQRHVRNTHLHFKRNRKLKFLISGSLGASFSLEGGLPGSETHQFLLPLMAESSQSILVFRMAFRTHSLIHESKWALGVSWWSSGQDCSLPLQRSWI